MHTMIFSTTIHNNTQYTNCSLILIDWKAKIKIVHKINSLKQHKTTRIIINLYYCSNSTSIQSLLEKENIFPIKQKPMERLNLLETTD